MKRGEANGLLNPHVLYSLHYGDLKALSRCRYPLATVGDMLAYIQDGLHGIRRYVPEGVPLLGVGNVTEEGIDLSDVNQITQLEHKRLAASHVHRGDLLITITGRIGTAAIYESDAPANLSAHVALGRPRPGQSLLYLKYYLASRFGTASLTKAKIGSTHPHINVRRLAELPIPLAPPKIQRKIAAFMENARAARNEKLRRADQLLASLDAYLLDTLDIPVAADASRTVFAIRLQQVEGALNPERYAGLILAKCIVGPRIDSIARILDAKISPAKVAPANEWDRIRIDSLWEFFNYQLYCTTRDDDGEPNRYRIDLPEIVGSKLLGDVRVCISLRRNARQEEGLMHELLHANLIPLRYPRFRIWEDPQSEKWPLAEGITNNADHIVMLPIYLSFGYSEDRFRGPSRLLSERERRVIEDLKGMATDLCTPDGYLTHLSAYLQHYNISFEAIHVADAIVQKKIEKCDAA